jgi:hypothetical protein
MRADNGTRPDAIVAAASAALTDAASHAHRLATALDTTHQHAAHLATA